MMKSSLIVLGSLALAGSAVAQVWNEVGDAPSFPDGAGQVTRAPGSLTRIVGATDSAASHLRDADCVRIDDPSSFRATTDPATDPRADGGFDTRLLLFHRHGAPVQANDKTPAAPGALSTLTGTATDGSGFQLTQPGEYALLIGGYPDDPQDAVDVAPFDIGTQQELVHAPNLAAGAFDHWAAPGTTETGPYTMVLEGVRSCQDELDAVFASAGRNRVCLGDGSGGFACSDVSTDSHSTRGVALGYVDDDQNLDAVFTNAGLRRGDKNHVCLGDGSGGFACSDVSTDSNSTNGVALGFVDGDQNLDAVFANFLLDQRNRVCLGDGSGGFACSDVSTDSNSTNGVALGFVDGDPFTDVVFANENQRNRVCLGNGSGGFACSDVSTDSNPTKGVALGFVDGDPFADAVFANENQRNRVCLGDGSGGFACSDVSADSNLTRGVALGLVDGDQNLDAVFANAGVRTGERNRLCLGDGSGGFACSDVSTDSNPTNGVALGFVDSDPFADVVFANESQRNRVCLGNGSGGFACSDVSTDSNLTTGVALGKVRFSEMIFADCFESGDLSAWSGSVP